jgi:hypothetical protein
MNQFSRDSVAIQDTVGTCRVVKTPLDHEVSSVTTVLSSRLRSLETRFWYPRRYSLLRGVFERLGEEQETGMVTGTGNAVGW